MRGTALLLLTLSAILHTCLAMSTFDSPATMGGSCLSHLGSGRAPTWRVVTCASGLLCSVSDGLPCPTTCNKNLCSKLTCIYGLGSGICNCCPRCLKGPFEKCGGLWNIVGICASGLVCTNQTSLDNDDVGICILKPKEQPGKAYGE